LWPELIERLRGTLRDPLPRCFTGVPSRDIGAVSFVWL
jgi:hypothetical protein